MRHTSRSRSIVSVSNLEPRSLLTTLIALVDGGLPISRNQSYYDFTFAKNMTTGLTGANAVDSGSDPSHGGWLTDLTVQGIEATKSQPGAAGADVKILPIKVGLSTSEYIQGIRYAAEKGAKVINVSLGESSNWMGGAIAYARSLGAIVVTAAGNKRYQDAQTGVNLDGSPVVPIFPAFSDDSAYNGGTTGIDNVIVATAVDSSGNLSTESNGTLIPNWGATHVDVGAPTNGEGKTSFSAGYLSGVIGVISELWPNSTYADRISLIKSTVTVKPQTIGGQSISNWSSSKGNVSPANAVQALNLTSSYIDDAPSNVGGFTRTTGWTNWAPASGYSGDHSTADPAATETQTATWSFTGLTPGQYRVRATWVQASNRASNAPYSFKEGTTSRGTAVANQQPGTTVDVYDGGLAWWYLGGADASYTVAGSTLTVSLGNNANGIVVADDNATSFL